jgi:glycosyltransferase involved in cell wall biosynthesis
VRIMQVLLHEGVGGMEVMAHSLGSGLEARGHVVWTHVLDRGARHAGEKRSASHRLVSLARARHTFRPHIVLAHSAIPTVYDRLLPVRGAPHVSVVHSPEFDLHDVKLRWAEHLLAHRASAIVFVSDAAMRHYERAFPRSQVPLLYIPNGVPIPDDQPQRRQVPPQKLLAVSRITPSKDLKTTIDAFRDYATREKRATLSIVGDAADAGYDRRLRSLAADLGASSSRVFFLGRRDDVGELMDGADLLVHSSHFEAQGLVLAEAAVRGLPTAVTRPVYAVRSWQGGAIVFEPGDSTELAARLSDMRSLEDLAHTVWSATDHNRLVLSQDLMVDRYERLLEGIVARDSRGLSE